RCEHGRRHDLLRHGRRRDGRLPAGDSLDRLVAGEEGGEPVRNGSHDRARAGRTLQAGADPAAGAAERKRAERRARRALRNRDYASRPAPQGRARRQAANPARRYRVLDRPGRRRAGCGARHRFLRGRARARLDHAAAGRPDVPRPARAGQGLARAVSATRSVHGIGMTSQRTRARMIERLREDEIRDERVLAAMQAVPRHLFVDEALASRAYEDTALPIGFGQTISQPYVVARMIELLAAGRDLGKVLEVGTGCGYQAAVLAQIAAEA